MNPKQITARLYKCLDALPPLSVSPADVVVMERAHPIFEGKHRMPGYKVVPTVCMWGPEQDREKDKPRPFYVPRMSALASEKGKAAALAQSEKRAKLLRQYIAEYNENPELRKSNETV